MGGNGGTMSPYVDRLIELQEKGELPSEFCVNVALETLQDHMNPKAVPGKYRLVSGLNSDPREIKIEEKGPDLRGLNTITRYSFLKKRKPGYQYAKEKIARLEAEVETKDNEITRLRAEVERLKAEPLSMERP